jgi:hypothetical protein
LAKAKAREATLGAHAALLAERERTSKLIGERERQRSTLEALRDAAKRAHIAAKRRAFEQQASESKQQQPPAEAENFEVSSGLFNEEDLLRLLQLPPFPTDKDDKATVLNVNGGEPPLSSSSSASSAGSKS